MIGHVGDLVILICGPHLIAVCAGNADKILILQGCLHDKRHIVGRGVVILVGQSMGIGKMGVGTAKLCRLLVHQLYESVNGSGHMLSQAVATLISRFEHQGVEGFFHGQLFAFCGSDGAAACLDRMGRVVGIGHNLIEGAVIQRHKGRHNLGDAGRVIDHIHILIIKDGSGVRFHDDGGFGVDLRPLGPAFDGIGIDGFIVDGLALGLGGFRCGLLGGGHSPGFGGDGMKTECTKNRQDDCACQKSM